jgi:hypothetical protein
MQLFNANLHPPADSLCKSWAATPLQKILTTTARNYQLEAELAKIAAQFANNSKFPPPEAAAPHLSKEYPDGIR